MTLVVLTGATRGIGRAAAIELAERGAEVVVVGREPERVAAVVGEAQAAGGGVPVHSHVADLALMASVRSLAEELRDRHEQIDVLANNAGALPFTAPRSSATSCSRMSSPSARPSCAPTAFTPASCVAASARTTTASGSC